MLLAVDSQQQAVGEREQQCASSVPLPRITSFAVLYQLACTAMTAVPVVAWAPGAHSLQNVRVPTALYDAVDIRCIAEALR